MKISLCSLVLGACSAVAVPGADVDRYVNPFIGTAVGSGNTYPGPQVPLGMISWSPQSLDFGWSPAGYSYQNDKINGFGLIHLSGAGCSASCELPFIPCTGALNTSPATHRNDYASAFVHSNEVAHPGYYSVRLATWDIGFENTVAARSGIAHLDFPRTPQANAKYIQSLALNGKPFSKLWLTVDELKRGCTLDFVMGNQPNTNWATATADVPPSFEPDSTVRQEANSSMDAK